MERDRERRRADASTEDAAGEAESSQLRAFLESDLHGDQADPDFRERLRRTLWSLVRRLYQGSRSTRDH